MKTHTQRLWRNRGVNASCLFTHLYFLTCEKKHTFRFLQSVHDSSVCVCVYVINTKRTNAFCIYLNILNVYFYVICLFLVIIFRSKILLLLLFFFVGKTCHWYVKNKNKIGIRASISSLDKQNGYPDQIRDLFEYIKYFLDRINKIMQNNKSVTVQRTCTVFSLSNVLKKCQKTTETTKEIFDIFFNTLN